MKDRHNKIVLEAEKGITLEVSEETSGRLIIKALNTVSNEVYSELPTVSAGEYAKVLSVYTDKNGNKAVVPQGWTVSGASKENIIWGKNNGLVIYHIPELIVSVNGIDWQNPNELRALMETYDQFVWTPVGLLTANATLDGIHFNEKFGRINYLNDEFSESEFHEPLTSELFLQKKSVEKYGGYYSSRYDISRDKNTGKPRSVMYAMPWRNINFLTVKEITSTMVVSKTVTSHLMYGAEYDTLLKWVIESGAATSEEIVEDSTVLGNYCKNYNFVKYECVILRTGDDGLINNIYGLAGNVYEWTQEKYADSYTDLCYVVRGGDHKSYGSDHPVAYRAFDSPFKGYDSIGFRATLYIK